MKKILYTLSILAIALGMASCSGGSGDISKNATPSEAAISMWKLVQDGDYAAAIRLSEEYQNATDDDIEQMASIIEALYSKVGGLKDVEVLEETVSEDGQSAVVKLKLTYGNGKTDTQKEKLVMTENGWRPAK